MLRVVSVSASLYLLAIDDADMSPDHDPRDCAFLYTRERTKCAEVLPYIFWNSDQGPKLHIEELPCIQPLEDKQNSKIGLMLLKRHEYLMIT